MESLSVFISAYVLVFVGELGDKTQLATGTGTLANRNRIYIVFFSSILALTTVAGLTVFFAGLIPETALPFVQSVGGGLLIIYGIYLYRCAEQLNDEESNDARRKNGIGLFVTHFSVVFTAELGDKTQIATLALAVENQANLMVVFTGSVLALVTVTGLTVWGATKVPIGWISRIQKLGAGAMSAYGIYMLVS